MFGPLERGLKFAPFGEDLLAALFDLFLFGLNGAMGVQVNIVPLVGLYLEPEVSYALNEGTLETFRYDNRFVITFRGGLRFNF